MFHPRAAISGLLLCVCCFSGRSSAEEFVSGSAFQNALRSQISGTWDHVRLRDILKRISDERQIAILLDRRIDPSRELSLSAAGQTTSRFLELLVLPVGGKTSEVGQIVYLGPETPAGKLRTLIALRRAELFDEPSGISEGRQLELNRRTQLTWHDLDRPVDLVRRIGQQYQLQIEGLEQVPHDLWAQCILPQANAIDSLALLLVQFDLGFEWTNQAQGIRIIPLPLDLALERTHAPPAGMTAAAAAAAWIKAMPGLVAQADQGQVTVHGTVEQHEQIEELRRPGAGKEKPAPAPARNNNLNAKRITLRIQDTQVSALMRKLSQYPDLQLAFEYNADKLQKAGIDLDQRISFEVKQATVQELLEAMFKPLKIAFKVDGRKVTLEAK